MKAAFLAPIALLTFLAAAPALAADAAMTKASASLAEKSVAASASGDMKRARRLLEEAIVADPSNTRALSLLGRLYKTQGNTAFARKYYESALRIDPGVTEALHGVGMLDVTAGKLDDAREKLRTLSAVCPACAETGELARAIAAAPAETNPKTQKTNP
jgi:Flp pilus assembly protein TadD